MVFFIVLIYIWKRQASMVTIRKSETDNKRGCSGVYIKMAMVFFAFMLIGCMAFKNTPGQPVDQEISAFSDAIVISKVEPVSENTPVQTISKNTPDQPAEQKLSVAPDAIAVGSIEPVRIKKPGAMTSKKKIVPSDSQKKAISSDLLIIGEVEPVSINKVGLTMSARIDTGAETSSLNATGITVFERDGKRWVKFTVKDSISGKTAEVESRLKRTVLIKWQDGAPEERPVVKLQARLGAVEQVSEFTLTDRSSFEFPVLIGRNFLNGKFIVDVNRKNVTSPMNEKESRDK
jgi:hypothetical protein